MTEEIKGSTDLSFNGSVETVEGIYMYYGIG